MTFQIQAYDVAMSFAVGTLGRSHRRLMNHRGESQLGESAWLIGFAAYELLRLEDGRRVTNDDIPKYAAATLAKLDEFFVVLEGRHSAKTIDLVRPATGESVAALNWRHGDWPWKVKTVGQFMLELPSASAVDVVRDYGADFLVAALYRLDDAAIAARLDDSEGAGDFLIDAAWFIERVQTAEQIEAVSDAKLRTLDSRRASDRAKHRHAIDPKRAARDFVFECWQAWQAKPTQYANASAFARAMVDKNPDVLTSEVVIARWVRDWAKQAK